MAVDESLKRAKEAAAKLPFVPGDVSELLRADAVTYCSKLPEPPVYRRRDDPARIAAHTMIAEGESLLSRAYQSNERLWVAALEAWLTTLHHIAEGKVELAEVSWLQAQRLEQRATGRQRIYAVSDETKTKVFDPLTRQSRFDPQPERTIAVKLPCPSCRKVSDVSFSPRLSHHQFLCAHCRTQWAAYFGEARSAEISRRGNKRAYSFRLTELTGAQTRVEVEDASSGELQVARNDLLAFLYLPRPVLRGVLNLSSSRVLWVTGSGPCFVATVAFGSEASELDVLRGFRDRVLLQYPVGRRVVEAYYARGPRLARYVNARPWVRTQTRRALRLVVRVLSRHRDE
jgi:hypothetical protein